MLGASKVNFGLANPLVSYPPTNLLQYVDKRYYTSGTTWADQSGGTSYNMTFNGTISQSTTYGGTIGTFRFPSGQTSQWLNMGTAIRSLSSSSAWTMVFVARAVFGTNKYGVSIANTGNNNVHIVGNTSNWTSWLNPTANSSNPASYQMIVYYYNGSNTKVYTSNNGTTYTSGGTQNDIRSTTFFVLNQEQDSNLGGFDSNQASDWYISAFMLYDEVVSSADIAQLEAYFKQYYPIATA